MKFYLVSDTSQEGKERHIIIELDGVFYSVCLDRGKLLKKNWSRDLESLVDDLENEDNHLEIKEPDYFEVKEMKPV